MNFHGVFHHSQTVETALFCTWMNGETKHGLPYMEDGIQLPKRNEILIYEDIILRKKKADTNATKYMIPYKWTGPN